MRSSTISCIAFLVKIPSSSSSHRPHPAFVNRNILPVMTTAFDTNIVFAGANDGGDGLYDAEEAAALDAHDISDPGMEGAAMERAVIMAVEFKEQQIQKGKDELLEVGDAEANFAHDLSDAAAIEHANKISVGDSDDKDADADTTQFDAEEAAAVDAHDVSDAGIEGAAMERSVIVADELIHELQSKRKEDAAMLENAKIMGEELIKELQTSRKEGAATVENANAISAENNGAKDADATLFDAEEAAAVDAHDVSDAGIEGAAMERSVIVADELIRELQSKRKEDAAMLENAKIMGEELIKELQTKRE